MASLSENASPRPTVLRSSDGYPVHPAHGTYHLVRLLLGSVMGGWTAMLAFMALGFLGTIEFVNSAGLAAKWILVGGSILGVAAGAVLGVLASLVYNVIPALRRTVHTLALVRAGFMFLTLWPLLALIAWPTVSWGFWGGPLLAAVIAWISVEANPHAELVPHSTLGRALGTAIGPLLAMAFLLAILVPMFNRGFGDRYHPKLVFVAVDGLDGPLLNEMLASSDRDRLTRLAGLKDNCGYATLSSEQPLVSARLWADMLTGTRWEDHGILDRNSSSGDLASKPLWEILRTQGISCGLFQMLPLHPLSPGAKFDVPPPEDRRALTDPRARALAEVRGVGRKQEAPNPWHVVYVACRLARLGVKLDTITDLFRQLSWEWLAEPSPRLIYAQRKLMQFRIEADCAMALMRSRRAEAVFLRFPSLEPLFFEYWRYSKPRDFRGQPEDVDCALAAGLAQVLPDAYRQLDRLLEDLESYRGIRTVLVIASNHGERSSTDRRLGQWIASPRKLLEITGWESQAVGDLSATGACLRLRLPESSEAGLEELEAVLSSAEWSPEQEEVHSSRNPRRIFSVAPYPECLEVSIQTSAGLERGSIVTIGEWTGRLSEILEVPEPRSGLISDSGLLLIAGSQFRNGAQERNASIFDLAPTVLHALGIGLAEYLAGDPLDELFRADWLETNSYVRVEKYEPPVAAPPVDFGRPSAGEQESLGFSVYEEEPLQEDALSPYSEFAGP